MDEVMDTGGHHRQGTAQVMNEQVKKTFLVLERGFIPIHSTPDDSEASGRLSNSPSGTEKVNVNKLPPLARQSSGPRQNRQRDILPGQRSSFWTNWRQRSAFRRSLGFGVEFLVQNSDHIIKRHSRSVSERESRLFYRNIGSPIKAFGVDEKNPEITIRRPKII
jgi:hypothetical protein